MYYLINTSQLKKATYAWYSTAAEASKHGARVGASRPTATSPLKPEGVEGRDFVIYYSNYL